MTRICALPPCSYRYGRTDIVELDSGKKTARMMICCGYRETDPEECIMCTGYFNIKFEFSVVHFIKAEKDLRFKGNKRRKNTKNLGESKDQNT